MIRASLLFAFFCAAVPAQEFCSPIQAGQSASMREHRSGQFRVQCYSLSYKPLLEIGALGAGYFPDQVGIFIWSDDPDSTDFKVTLTFSDGDIEIFTQAQMVDRWHYRSDNATPQGRAFFLVRDARKVRVTSIIVEGLKRTATGVFVAP